MPGKAATRQAQDGRTVRFTTIKARLYPTPAQEKLFQNTFGCCRYIWNQMLSDHERFYSETGTHFIPTPAKYKNGAPFLREVDNQALIQEHNKLSQAFKVFFKKPESFGYPRFKTKKHDRDSFTACNHVLDTGPTIYLTADGVRMTKAGIVKARFPRRPRNGWRLKRVTVERTKSGRYFCCILFEYTTKTPEPVVPREETTLGLKYSMTHFCADSEGDLADPPRWLERSAGKLAKLQRQLSRMTPGSNNYRETVQRYYRLHERITNQRRDFLHKQSGRIANGWDAVCVRDEALPDMAKLMPGGNVQEAGYGQFRAMLAYKLERQGKVLIMVDRYSPVTRTCSACGTSGGPVTEGSWTCPRCGAAHDREINAARNIKAEGLKLYFDSEERRRNA